MFVFKRKAKASVNNQIIVRSALSCQPLLTRPHNYKQSHSASEQWSLNLTLSLASQRTAREYGIMRETDHPFISSQAGALGGPGGLNMAAIAAAMGAGLRPPAPPGGGDDRPGTVALGGGGGVR